MPSIQLEKRLGPTKKAVDIGLDDFNERFTGPVRKKDIVISLRDDGGAIVGGLWAVLFKPTLFIKWFWIDDAYRGRGFGAKMMAMAEARALALGAKQAYLDTFSFQARPFYEKLGYEVFGTLEDFFEGQARYWMKKSL